MNELIDRILDMPVRQRVLLLIATVFPLFFMYAYLIYWPRAESITEKRSQLADLLADRARKAAVVANLAQARREIGDLNAALKQAIARLPDTKEIPDLLSAISSVARESGLEIQQFRQKPEVYQEFYAEVPVEILVRGTYWQVESFFQRVSDLTRIVNVSDINVKAPPLIESDPIKLQTSCAATTFRFLGEEERQRIPKEHEKKEGKR